MGRPRNKAILKALFNGVFLAVVAFCLSISKLGIPKETERLSDKAIQYISSPFYARGLTQTGTPIGQDRISVLYLDEPGLAKLKDSWKTFPPSYANQAELVEDVTAQRVDADGAPIAPPRAVFLDFNYLREGLDAANQFDRFAAALATATNAVAWQGQPLCADNDELVKIACMVAARGIPIIIGGEKDGSDGSVVNGRLRHAAALASLTIGVDHYPMFGPPPFDPGLDRASPAALLYAAECLVQARDAAKGGYRCAHPDEFKALLDQAAILIGHDADAISHAADRAEALSGSIRTAARGDFQVRWSDRQQTGETGANALYKALYGQDSPCDTARAHGWPIKDFSLRVVEKLTPAGSFGQTPRKACPYALSLSYGDWVTGPTLPPALARRVFSDRLVLIGLQLSNTNDWASSPVHGRVAGVHYHAMALDNLIESAGRRGKPPRRVDGLSSLLSKLGGALLIMILVFVGGWQQVIRNDLDRRLEAEEAAGTLTARGRMRRLGGLYLRFFLFSGAIILVSIATAVHLQWPINWILIGSVVFGYGLWSVRKTIGEDFKPLIDLLPWKRLSRWVDKKLSLDREVLHPWRSGPPQKSPLPQPVNPPPATEDQA